MKHIVPFALWLLFGMVFGGTVVYFSTHWRDPSFLDGVMGNCLATMVGVLLGIPVALAISRAQQAEADAQAQQKHQKEEDARTVKVLRLVRNELQYNLDRLASRQPGHTGQDKRVVRTSRLKDELWRALSDGGELQWVRDLDLLDAISRAYHSVRIILYLEDRYFDAAHYPGMQIHQERYPQDRILDYLTAEDPNVTDHIEAALTQIDKRLEELGAKQPVPPLEQQMLPTNEVATLTMTAMEADDLAAEGKVADG